MQGLLEIGEMLALIQVSDKKIGPSRDGHAIGIDSYITVKNLITV